MILMSSLSIIHLLDAISKLSIHSITLFSHIIRCISQNLINQVSQGLRPKTLMFCTYNVVMGELGPGFRSRLSECDRIKDHGVIYQLLKIQYTNYRYYK